MGLLSPAWRDNDVEKAKDAVTALKSDGALLRAAKGARDETVALYAVSRIDDELLLERLVFDEPDVSARVAGAALLRIADHDREFSAILQRLEHEASGGDAQRATTLLTAAMDLSGDPKIFTKLLACLGIDARNAYLKRSDRDDDFMADTLLYCVGQFPRSAHETEAMLWRFSDTVILKALGTLQNMAAAMSDSAPKLVEGLRAREAVLEAIRTAESTRIRLIALKKIVDEQTLLYISLNNDSSEVREEAADRLQERADVVRFIAERPQDVTEPLLKRALRPAPAGKKSGRSKKNTADDLPALSQEQLLNVSVNSWDHDARQKAASLLEDPSDINHYARHNMNLLDEKTVLRMTSQPLLAEIAGDTYNRFRQPLRMAAVSRLTSDERLGEVVEKHTESYMTEDARAVVYAALDRIEDQDVIYRALGIADGRKTYIGADALRYITDNDILVKIALGGGWFDSRAAERVEGEPELKKIAEEAFGDDSRKTAVRKLEDLHIAALGTADESVLEETARFDPSPRVRIEAVRRVNDQDVLEEIALGGDSPDILAAAAKRLTRWPPLLRMLQKGKVPSETIAGRLCEDVFAEKRSAILTSASEYLRQGSQDAAERYAETIAALTGETLDDVYVRYGGMEYIQSQIDRLVKCRELDDFAETYRFLCYAYKEYREYRGALLKVGKRTLSIHYDYNAYCGEDSCNVTIEKAVDFESV